MCCGLKGWEVEGGVGGLWVSVESIYMYGSWGDSCDVIV